MGAVYIEDLRPGMVLSADARSRQGRLLFSKGLELDEISIQTLKFWGVTEALVDGRDQETIDRERLRALDPSLARSARDEAARRLSANPQDHPAIRELKRVAFLSIVSHGMPDPAQPLPDPGPAPDPRKRPSLERLANGAVKLASLPGIVTQALEALNDPNSSYGYVAGIISKDTALSAKLLKLVNSALFGFPEPVDTISRAVTVVGASRLTSLALGVSLISVFKSVPRHVLNMRSFWEHSLACGALARNLAACAGHPSEERCFVEGLLHDIGRLVMLKNHPAHVTYVIAQAARENIPVRDAEREIWGFDHAGLGGRLLESWKFPPALVRAVGGHHGPDGKGIHPDAAITHVADVLAHALAFGHSGSPVAPPLAPGAWEHLNIPKSALGAAAAQAQRQLDEIGGILLEDESHEKR
jgi:HD-like signal output (HDOD) protein